MDSSCSANTKYSGSKPIIHNEIAYSVHQTQHCEYRFSNHGGAFKINLTNADVWDGSSTTDWTGSGTETDPYLITKASQLAGLSSSMSVATTYSNEFFKLANDLDMNGIGFSPIGYSARASFNGTLDGDNHSIINLSLLTATGMDTSVCAMFGYAGSQYDDTSTNISNLSIDVVGFGGSKTRVRVDTMTYTAGLVGIGRGTITNVHVTLPESVDTNAIQFGGIAAQFNGTVSDSTAIGGVVENSSNTLNVFGGLVATHVGNIKNCHADISVNLTSPKAYYLGGIVGVADGVTITNCLYDGNITLLLASARASSACIGGIAGTTDSKDYFYNCLFQGTITYQHCGSGSSDNAVIAGIVIGGRFTESIDVSYCISNGEINCSGFTSSDNEYEVYGAGNTSSLVYNSSKVTAGVGTFYKYGETTDADIKFLSTYADWVDFDTYWIINPNVNSGYPMLKSFADMSAILEFDGEGTAETPYQIKNLLDFINFQKYYNEREKRKADFYWQLMEDINISTNANDTLIHHVPVGKENAFDGYFDGNGKTISGLLIDNQYEYAGLFGTVAANHWVKNLTVKGNIYWDEAYAVGGVAGRVLAGGYLQNCSFKGNIIGVLNTKTSTETSGVIGKYEINGAIDCTATYTDIKYAKIGGTAESPTYTYYLYDWAQMTTYLYNKKVA